MAIQRRSLVLAYDPVTALVSNIPYGSLFGLFSLRDYATDAQLKQNAQPYVNMALVDAKYGGIVLFPPGVFALEQIVLSQGVYIQGCGAAATILEQVPGINKSLIVSNPTIPGPGFLHYTGVSRLSLQKKKGSVDTIGCGIEMNCRSGELCQFSEVFVGGWPQSGIRLNHAGQPAVMRDIHAFNCQEYGIDLRRASGDIWHMVNLDTVSGDNHGKGLIHIDGALPTIESFHISNVKSESNPCVIELDGLNGSAVTIEHVSNYGIKPATAVIKISSSQVKILGGVIRASGTPLLIDDIPANRQVPYNGNRLGWAYDSNVGLL